jgi:Glu-tRNA(Gln) amidotransferase subunit E-like FAD-binding protein
VFPSNLENKTRNKTLESIIERQDKTIKLIYEERRKAFEKGFL